LSLAAALAMASVQSVSSAAFAQTDPEIQQGMSVIQKHRCGGCHTIPGIPGANGNIGPDLGPNGDIPPVSARNPMASGLVPNNSADDMVAWLVNPPALKPGTLMPNLGLTDEEAALATAYLYAIQPDGSVAGLADGN
jgi:cytochrome c2